jgi:isopropylmalate/homocitrate/citramalate synthase
MTVVVCDVAPRDGLQNDPRALAPHVRAQLAERLAASGVPRVEVASFVDPRRVPQMAGAEEVVAALPADAGAGWSGLVLNERGFDRAVAAGLERINVAVGVTDAFCRRNQGRALEEVVAMAVAVAGRGRECGVAVTVTLAVAFGCPFEGRVTADAVFAVADRVAAGGPSELVVADTIGVGVPTQVRALVSGLEPLGIRLGAHFHDTRNTGIANAVAAVEAGVGLLDAAVGGAGGCPFAPGATGNVATEDLVYVLEAMGVGTGIDLGALLECTAWLAARLGHDLPSALGRAGDFSPSPPADG